MAGKKGDGAVKHCDPGLPANPRHLVHLLVFSAEGIYGHLQLPDFFAAVTQFSSEGPSPMFQQVYQQVPPYIAVNEVVMPVFFNLLQ